MEIPRRHVLLAGLAATVIAAGGFYYLQHQTQRTTSAAITADTLHFPTHANRSDLIVLGTVTSVQTGETVIDIDETWEGKTNDTLALPFPLPDDRFRHPAPPDLQEGERVLLLLSRNPETGDLAMPTKYSAFTVNDGTITTYGNDLYPSQQYTLEEARRIVTNEPLS